MERGGYIKVFRNPNGHRGGYYVLIHNYKVRFGSLVGHYLDALATTHHSKPVYKKASCDRVGTASRPRHNPVTTASVQTSLPDIPERTDDDTSQAQGASEVARSLSDRPLQAAKEAFSILSKDMVSEMLAYQMILWVLYGAARSRTIPQDANYYITAHQNFEAQHDFGGETILDNAIDRFEKHAASFLAERAPEVLEWLRGLCAELEAQSSSEVDALCSKAADPQAIARCFSRTFATMIN